MKRRVSLTLIAMLYAGPALAEDMDMSKIKCKEFISASKEEIGTILTWLEGYYTKETDPPIMFSDKTVKDAKNLSAYCNAHGDEDMVTAAETVMPAK